MDINPFSSVQLLGHVWFFVIPFTATWQAFLFNTNFQSLLKLMSIESVMPSNHLILCHPFSFCLQSCPASEYFPRSQFFTSGGQSIGVSASASVLPTNRQDWSPVGLTGLISLQSQGLSRVFSNTTVQKRQSISLLLNENIWTSQSHWKSKIQLLPNWVNSISKINKFFQVKSYKDINT